MTRPLPLLLLGLSLTACNGISKVDLWGVLTSGRDGWQHPERVVESLEVRPGDVVADIGAGDGYFLPWLSRAVGPSGQVYAVEVDDEKTAELRELVEEQGLENVEVIRGEFEDPLLPDGRIDLVFTCLTYHHIDGRTAYFERLLRDLSPRGRVAHLDDRDDVGGILGLFLTEGHWMNVDRMVEEMLDAGYRRVASFDFLVTQSFQVFVPNLERTEGRLERPEAS